jgi:predicted nucleic acid-binding protein
MTKYIFTDTSALIAVLNKKDQYHDKAAATFHSILNGPSSLLITSHIFAETLTRIARRVSQQAAITAGARIRNEARIAMVTPTHEALDQAWEIFQSYHDQQFSFVDCISFAVMREMDLSRAFSFDKHFQIMGFESIEE